MNQLTNIYDISKTQFDLVNHMEGKLDVTLSDPTSPFLMMLEAIADTASQSTSTTAGLIRQSYPTLCSNQYELLRHVNEDELLGLFANPAISKMTLYINGIDILSEGKDSRVGVDSKYIAISEGSRVIVNDVTFTIMNPIKVHFDGKIAIVEQESKISGFNRIGSIPSSVVVDDAKLKWIKFEVGVRQFDSTIHRIDLVGNFNYTIPYTDQLWKITVKGLYDSELKNIPITFSDIIYVPENLTIKIKPIENAVIVEVPAIYRHGVKLPNLLIVEISTTKGNIAMPLSHYITSDYVFKRASKDVNLKGVHILTNSDHVVTGGKNTKTFEEMRSNVINNTLGVLDTPITIDQLKERANRDGYDIKLRTDLITNRVFTISKNIDNGVFQEVLSEPDVYNNITLLKPNIELENITMFKDALIIKQNTLFVNNKGTMIPVEDKLLYDRFRGVGGYEFSRLYDVIKANRYMYTPYVNVIYPDYSCSSIDLKNPEVVEMEIINRNYLVEHIVNIDNISIEFVNDAFVITTSIIDTSTINLAVYNVRGQVIFYNTNGAKLAFDSEGIITEDNNVLKFYIKTNSYYDADGNIMITGGNDLLYNTVSNITDMTFIYYTDTPLLSEVGIYEVSGEVVLPNGVTDVTALVKERVTIKFGDILSNLFNEVGHRFTPRKYKKYEVDIPRFYTKDVMFGEIDDDWNADDAFDIAFKLDEAVRTYRTKEQIKNGDKGDIVYLHKAGDVILDGSENPIIDELQGRELLANILMFEVEYALFDTISNSKATSLLNAYVKEFVSYCDVFSAKRLESTAYKYLPIQTCDFVKINAVGEQFNVPQQISPSITVYIDMNSIINIDVFEVGKLIEKHIEMENIRLDTIRKALTSLMGVTAVSIEDMGIGYLFEIMTVVQNRFSLDKKLLPNGDVVYNINIDIVKV